MLTPVFPMNLIEQEVSTNRWIDIPDEVIQILYRWRPAPLRRAFNLEKHLGTPARIYYKDESTSPPGSHKPNTAVPQAWYNKQFGIKRLTTETGAGQWVVPLLSPALFWIGMQGLYGQNQFRPEALQENDDAGLGRKLASQPSNETNSGRKVLAEMPNTPGSLGIAISEAIEAAVTDPTGKTRYALGSVLNHVMLHQTIIGLEAKKQLKLAGEKKVDVVIGCAGGGSNFAGLSFPFVADKINGAQKIKIMPIEPTKLPDYDQRTIRLRLWRHRLHNPASGDVYAWPFLYSRPDSRGGLRYHGMAPLVCPGHRRGASRTKGLSPDQVL